MKAARFAVALLTIAAGAAAFYYFCLLPYRCNRIESLQRAATAAAYQSAPAPSARIAARQNVDALWPCRGATCRDVGIDMLLAANYHILGQEDEAIRCYRDALRLDQRPEIYFNLAVSELASGDRNAAREDLVRAALFNRWILASIEDGVLRREVMTRLIALYPEEAELIRTIDKVVLP